MKVSRDEAREVAAVALALTIGLRILSGVVQVIDELNRGWTWGSLAGRFLAPVGSTMGLLTLALVMLLVLSPNGSVSPAVFRATRYITVVVAVLGALSVVNSLTAGLGSVASRLWFVLLNGSAAAVLGGAAWWIITRFDPDR